MRLGVRECLVRDTRLTSDVVDLDLHETGHGSPAGAGGERPHLGDPPVHDVLCGMAGKATVEEVFAGLAAGEPPCIKAVETAARYLGIALANVVTVLGPHRIVIGGGIAAAGESILAPIRAATLEHVTLVPHENVHIVQATLGSEAGAIGAALAAADAAAG